MTVMINWHKDRESGGGYRLMNELKCQGIEIQGNNEDKKNGDSLKIWKNLKKKIREIKMTFKMKMTFRKVSTRKLRQSQIEERQSRKLRQAINEKNLKNEHFLRKMT